jgi:hypothetical protein
MMAEGGRTYTTQLQAGLGLIEETKQLLSLYEPGMSAADLSANALGSGSFPMVSARRLRNIIIECFAPRYLKSAAAADLKLLAPVLQSAALNQLFLLHTAEANAILHDFIQEVYWEHYTGGRSDLSLDDARSFVTHAVRESKTHKPWSASTIKHVGSYLIGCCADYGLISKRKSTVRTILPFRIQESTAIYLAYRLHFSGHGDNAVIGHESWRLFGLEYGDVQDEFRKLARNGRLIFQSAGDIASTSWKYRSMKEVADVIAEG